MPKGPIALPLTAATAALVLAAVGLAAIASPLASAQAIDATPSPSGAPTPTSGTPAAGTEPGPTPTPTASPKDAPISTWPDTMLVGTSVRGRPIYASRQGNPAAPKVLLAIGVIHGNEKAGQRIIDAVRGTTVPTNTDYQIWTIRSMNPDGLASYQRRNARGVDLNRNFPTGWSRKTAGAGIGPGSEPETQALMSFIARLHPDATLVYHQDWNMVLGSCNWKTRSYALRYANLTGLRSEKCGRASYTGTMGSWVNSNFPGYLLTVELPGSRRVTARKIGKWRNSVGTAARELNDLDTTLSGPAIGADEPTPSPSASPSPSTSPSNPG